MAKTSDKKQKTSAKSKKKAARPSLWSRLRTMLHADGEESLSLGEMAAGAAGIVLFVFAMILLLSFSSTFFTGKADAMYAASGNPDGIVLAEGVAASPDNAEMMTCTPHNLCGRLGVYLVEAWMNGLFGLGSFFIPIYLILLAVRLLKVWRVRLISAFLHTGFLMLWLSVALSVAQNLWMGDATLRSLNVFWGGRHGDALVRVIDEAIGTLPLVILLAGLMLGYLCLISLRIRRWVHEGWLSGRDRLGELGTKAVEAVKKAKDGSDEDADTDGDETTGDDGTPEASAANGGDEYQDDPSVKVEFSTEDDRGADTKVVLEDATFEIEATHQEEEFTDTDADASAETPAQKPSQPVPYKFPSLDLLAKPDSSAPTIDMDEQNANKEKIISVLRNFKVDITSIRATIGPTITLYEITPAAGVRISRIKNLEDDIAMGLSALGIRIIAPMPGRGTIGIEVPNARPQTVSMQSILGTKKYQQSDMQLPLALGKTITNDAFIVDLAKLPHLLVAGATGMGKSVGLNAIIASLLYKKKPEELKFVLVDPKRVEFSPYAPIEKHYLIKIDNGEDAIITDTSRVVDTLKSLCALMDRRYELLRAAKVRNIKEYNARWHRKELSPNEGHEFMPYIVVIIDEFGDLIMTAGKQVELPIARLAQLARAIGIHLIIATQRPTVNIITGTIKANFPARLAFRVMQRNDSQTILDRPGANQLIGRGDLLFLNGGEPVRVQCAFIDTPEVERITDYISRQPFDSDIKYLPDPPAEDGGEGTGNVDLTNLDPMLPEVARAVVVKQMGSTSFIQRQFSIGFARSGRITDQLEALGIVGPARGSKPREVLIQDLVELDNLLAQH